MARLKPRNSITTTESAVSAMARLNQIDTQLAGWDLDEAEDIALVREEHVNAQNKAGRPGLETEKALLVKEIESWAMEAQTAWETRTLETPFGNMGFRLGTPAVVLIKRVARSFKEAIELVKIILPAYVRESPEIDKAAILAADRDKTLNVGKLNRCGLMVDQEEQFWIETNASKDLDEASKKLKCA